MLTTQAVSLFNSSRSMSCSLKDPTNSRSTPGVSVRAGAFFPLVAGGVQRPPVARRAHPAVGAVRAVRAVRAVTA